MTLSIFSPPTVTGEREMTVAELDRAGLLYAEEGARISRFAIFVAIDETGEVRPVIVGHGAMIGPFAVVHGGTTLLEHARVEDRVVVGQPELGYAVGGTYSGIGGETVIGAGAVLRAGAIVYAGSASEQRPWSGTRRCYAARCTSARTPNWDIT